MIGNYTIPADIIFFWFCATLFLVLINIIVYARYRYALGLKELQHQNRLAELDSALSVSRAHLESVEKERLKLVADCSQLSESNSTLKAEFAGLQARLEQRELGLLSEIASLQAAKESVLKEFESLASRLFEAKQEQFSRTAQIQMQQIMAPFREQLHDFRSKVEEVQTQDTARHHQLIGQILELQKQSQQIGLDAVNLANALKGNNKMMGSWGEMLLQNTLEQMGFQLGRDFHVQVSYINDEGRRLQPDVLVCLPDEKDLIIDAKVSLLAYERYCSYTDEMQRSEALKEHVDSIRAHIRSLDGKNYAQHVGRKRLDFVCLFVPIEAAFVTAVQRAPELLQEAYDKQIILVSPASLFVVLRTVSALWQRHKQDKNVEQIVISAGKLHDQFVRFLESMQEVGAGIEKANRSFQVAMARLESGNGNLIKRSDDLRRLGARTHKTIPAKLRESATNNGSHMEDSPDV